MNRRRFLFYCGVGAASILPVTSTFELIKEREYEDHIIRGERTYNVLPGDTMNVSVVIVDADSRDEIVRDNLVYDIDRSGTVTGIKYRIFHDLSKRPQPLGLIYL